MADPAAIVKAKAAPAGALRGGRAPTQAIGIVQICDLRTGYVASATKASESRLIASAARAWASAIGSPAKTASRTSK